MSDRKLIVPKDYKPTLDIMETEIAIKLIKDTFERKLSENLNLTRVSAPLFVRPESGLNDDLNGIERPVQFDILETGFDVQIIHSLAKWKRLALQRYKFTPQTGLYTDMNAIRRDEELDNIHSIYVDQWDWEKIICASDRNTSTLKDAVNGIMQALRQTQVILQEQYSDIPTIVSEEVFFITSNDLYKMYPDKTPKEREDAICKLHQTVFIMQIGGVLENGEKHDGRAPDYDDWTLNGDILVWYPILNRSIEISSMGIRVDSATLDKQLTLASCDHRRKLDFHKKLLNDELPLTMGGGIGQSRICMLLLGKAHIGEVQSSVWATDMIEECDQNNINIL